jgi:hypothetical protein
MQKIYYNSVITDNNMPPDNLAKAPLNCLLETSWFSQMLANVKQLQHLHTILNSVDVNIALHCQVASSHNSCLRLEVKNSAWLMRIRYAAPQLIKGLRKYSEFTNLKNIECYVSPLIQSPKIQRLPNKISYQNKQLIQYTLASIKDNDLKTALSKLAK